MGRKTVIHWQLAYSLAIILSGTALAAETNRCPPPFFYQPLPPATLLEQSQVVLDADKVQTENRQVFSFEGNAKLRHKEHQLNADTLIFDRMENQVQAEGNVIYRGQDFQIEGSSSRLNLKDEFVDIKDARYYLSQQGGRGYTRNIHLDPKSTELESASYTTCAGDTPAWRLQASKINIRQQENFGEAYNVQLKLAQIPVLYLPYINFPLGQRKSGLLTPTFSNTSKSGLGVSAPVYWNIAPNYDATITPRVWENRGFMLENEGRYLFKDHAGQIHLHALPQDDVYGDKRYLYALIQRSRFGERHELELNMKHVSDQDYFRDLGSSLDADSQIYLDRHVTWRSHGKQWRFLGGVQDFQMLAPDIQEPYRRLPYLNLRYRDSFGPMMLEMRSAYHHFQRSTHDDTQRLIVEPELGISIANASGYLHPRLQLRESLYHIENTRSSTISRQFGSARVDGKLFFDRESNNRIDTVAPRLTYIYAPYIDQNDIRPLDTQAVDLRMGQLFEEQRFTGGDRWGDKHELIVATQLYATDLNSGLQSFRANVAEVFVLDDERVVLDDETGRRRGEHITAIELGSQITESLATSAQWFYQNQDQQTAKGAFRVNYATAEQSSQLSYLFREGWLEQIAASAYFRVRSGWNVAGRWSYSLRRQLTQEVMAGVEYDNCCWSLRLSAQQYRSGTNGEINHSIGLQLELKGLTKFGSELKQEFERNESTNGLVY